MSTPIRGHFFIDGSGVQCCDSFTVDRALWKSMTPAERRAHLNEILLARLRCDIDAYWVIDSDSDSDAVAAAPAVTW